MTILRTQVQVCDIQSTESLMRTSDELAPVDLLLTNVPQIASAPNDHNRLTIGVLTTLDTIQMRRKANPGASGCFFTDIFQLQHGFRSTFAVVERRISPSFVFGPVRVLTLHRGIMDSHTFAGLFSALPCSQTLHTLRLVATTADFPWQLTKLECAWLLYALVHPQTQVSKWKKLVLRNCDPMRIDEVVEEKSRLKMLSATRLMQLQLNKKRKRGLDDRVTVRPSAVRGDNMLQPRLAQVRMNAEIHSQPDASSAKLVVFQKQTQLEICNLRVGEWHCVLVPGFGFGWARDRDIKKIWKWTVRPQQGSQEAESTLSSPLTSLVLNGECLCPARVQQLLNILGDSLHSFELKMGRMNSDILGYIAEFCPNVKSLAIKSKMLKLKGSSLRAFFADSRVCKLRSLTLNWGICNSRVLSEILTMPNQFSVVNALEELHICYVKGSEFLDRLTEFEVMLNNNLVLERFYVSGSEHFEEWNLLRSYNGRVVATEKSLRARLGFLSVAATGSSVVSTLNVDLMRIIFQFAVARRIVGAWPPPKPES